MWSVSEPGVSEVRDLCPVCAGVVRAAVCGRVSRNSGVAR